MLKHQKQLPCECVLTVAAILADVPVDELRRKWEEYSGISWKDAMLGDTNIALEAYRWVSKWMPSILVTMRWLEGFLPRTASTSAVLQSLPEGDCEPLDTGSVVAPPQGTGSIVVKYRAVTSHIVAYSEGVVYDPDHDGPEPWHKWFTQEIRSGFVQAAAFFPGP